MMPLSVFLTHALLLAVFLSACGPADNGGKAVPPLHELVKEGSCRSCRIVAETIAVLGDPSDTVAINEGATPVADSRGRFYLLEKGGSSVLVFGPDGKHMTTFGRAGKGPGEFDRLGEIHVAPGDTLVLIGSGVVHVVDPQYRHIRQSSLSEGSSAEFFNTMLSDGRVLRMSGENEFILVDKNGGASKPVVLQNVDTASCSDCGERTFREGIEKGTVWSGQQNSYVVQQHDTSGALVRGFVRRTHWFPDWKPPREGEAFDIATEMSRPRFFGVRQSADGLIWTHVLMIDDPEKLPNPAKMDPSAFEGSGAAAKKLMSDVMSNFVTMMEVLDPATGEALAGQELKMIVVPMLRDMVAQMRLDEHGDWSCVVMRLRLEGRGS